MTMRAWLAKTAPSIVGLPDALPNPVPPTASTPAPKGAIHRFASNADDPNWDLNRRRRAAPYARKAIVLRRQAKKAGVKYQAPAVPAELSPYVKAVGAGALAKFAPPEESKAAGRSKLRATLAEFKAGTLRSGKDGPVVTDKRQALAIAINQGKRATEAHAAASFDEAEHPRAQDGRFTSGGDAGIDRRLAALQARRDPDGIEAAQGKFAGLTEAQFKLRTEGVAPRLKTSSIFAQYRPDPDDKEWKGAPEGAPVMGRIFAEVKTAARIPKALGAAKTAELGAWAGKRTSEMRAEIIERAGRRGMIPGAGSSRAEAADPKDVIAAFNHARKFALHDVGLIDYDFKFNPEASPRFRALVPFMRYARNKLGDALMAEKAGEWAPFRREFGTPFKDGRVYAKDTRGQKAGEEKKSFYRHQQMVKRQAGTPLTQAEHDQRVAAAKRQKNRDANQEDAVVAAAGAGAAVRAGRAGLERVVGAQRYVHGAGSKAIRSIRRTGLDPSYGGSKAGGSEAIGSEAFKARSTGYVHVAKDNIIGRRFVANAHGALGQAHENATRAGRTMVRKEGMAHYIFGTLAANPLRNRVGGAMPYEQFRSQFRQDPDHIKGVAFKTNEKIGPENLSRSRAGFRQIIRARSKDLPGYVKANPGRFGRGAAALVGAGLAADQVRRAVQRIAARRAATNARG